MMSAAELRNCQQCKTEFVRISTDEPDRERAVRERFADFWDGERRPGARASYDALPLFGDLRGLLPLLIQVGTDERLLDDARAICRPRGPSRNFGRTSDLRGDASRLPARVAHLKSRVALDRAPNSFATPSTGDDTLFVQVIQQKKEMSWPTRLNRPRSSS